MKFWWRVLLFKMGWIDVMPMKEQVFDFDKVDYEQWQKRAGGEE